MTKITSTSFDAVKNTSPPRTSNLALFGRVNVIGNLCSTQTGEFNFGSCTVVDNDKHHVVAGIDVSDGVLTQAISVGKTFIDRDGGLNCESLDAHEEMSAKGSIQCLTAAVGSLASLSVYETTTPSIRTSQVSMISTLQPQVSPSNVYGINPETGDITATKLIADSVVVAGSLIADDVVITSEYQGLPIGHTEDGKVNYSRVTTQDIDVGAASITGDGIIVGPASISTSTGAVSGSFPSDMIVSGSVSISDRKTVGSMESEKIVIGGETLSPDMVFQSLTVKKNSSITASFTRDGWWVKDMFLNILSSPWERLVFEDFTGGETSLTITNPVSISNSVAVVGVGGRIETAIIINPATMQVCIDIRLEWKGAPLRFGWKSTDESSVSVSIDNGAVSLESYTPSIEPILSIDAVGEVRSGMVYYRIETDDASLYFMMRESADDPWMRSWSGNKIRVSPLPAKVFIEGAAAIDYIEVNRQRFDPTE